MEGKIIKNKVRQFKAGATRDADTGKICYFRLLDPAVLKMYCAYLTKHRVQTDGNIREPDNWKKGIPVQEYAESLERHNMDVWLHLHGYHEQATETLLDSLCGILFNTIGIMYELFAKRMKIQNKKKR